MNWNGQPSQSTGVGAALDGIGDHYSHRLEEIAVKLVPAMYPDLCELDDEHYVY